MNIIHIDSLDHPGLAPYARLTEAQLRSRLHPEEGVFICESEKVIRVALAAGVTPVSFLSESKYIDTQVRAMCEEYGVGEEIPVYTGEREVLAGLTGYELSRGVLCCMRRAGCYPLPATDYRLLTGMRRIAVLDSVVNSTNTGAIFRAAAALGIDALLLTRTCCDPLNRRACRVSMGTVFQIPWTWIENVECGMRNEELEVRKQVANDYRLSATGYRLSKSYPEILRELGFKTVALALTDRSVSIDDPVLKEPERLAIIMGTEGDGLSDSVLQQCDYVAKIPMQRGVDSLNVAAAASVAFYELRIKN